MDEAKERMALADQQVPISRACRLVGLDIPDYAGRGAKLYCPWGHLYHADGGVAKAFRVYPETNSVYCFAGCGAFRPVSLIAMDRGISREEAADYLLDLIGYVAPTVDARWAAVTQHVEVVDGDALTEALKVACARMDPLWEVHQFEEPVADRFRQCLELLSRVRTKADATTWLSTTKSVMRAQLGALTS